MADRSHIHLGLLVARLKVVATTEAEVEVEVEVEVGDTRLRVTHSKVGMLTVDRDLLKDMDKGKTTDRGKGTGRASTLIIQKGKKTRRTAPSRDVNRRCQFPFIHCRSIRPHNICMTPCETCWSFTRLNLMIN